MRFSNILKKFHETLKISSISWCGKTPMKD